MTATRTMTPAAAHAVARTLQYEGTGDNHPADKGGWTRWGISTRWNPDVDLATLTREQAAEIHWGRSWEPLGLDRLWQPDISARVFDACVLCGPDSAVRILQRALRACAVPCEEDGILGPHTIAAVNGTNVAQLLTAFRSEYAAHHRVHVARDPSQKVFLKGWLNRAYS